MAKVNTPLFSLKASGETHNGLYRFKTDGIKNTVVIAPRKNRKVNGGTKKNNEAMKEAQKYWARLSEWHKKTWTWQASPIRHYVKGSHITHYNTGRTLFTGIAIKYIVRGLRPPATLWGPERAPKEHGDIVAFDLE